jgi:hypothetical protein
MHNYCKTLQYPVQIDADIECDTFFPELDSSKWRLWSQSAPKRDADIRYSFQCYVPASASSTSERAPDLPAGLAAQHEEYQVCPGPTVCSLQRVISSQVSMAVHWFEHEFWQSCMLKDQIR